MKTEYRRDLQHSYLVLHVEEQMDEQAYPLKMITQNRIPGLLPCECRRIDDEILYYYDLTSKISLTEKCGARKVTGEEVLLIVYRFLQILIQMEEYLLSGDSLCLKAEQIYLDAEMKEVSFCYVPGERWNLEEQFRELMEGLLPFLDHQNQDGVMDVYGLYHYAVQEHFSVDGLRNQLEQYSRKREKKEPENQTDSSGERSCGFQTEENPEARELQSMERKQHEEALNAFFEEEEEETQTHPAVVTLGTMAVLVYLLSGWFLWRNFPDHLWIWMGSGLLAGVGLVFWYRKKKVLHPVPQNTGCLKEQREFQNKIPNKMQNDIQENISGDLLKNVPEETTVLSGSSFETQLLGAGKEKTTYILKEKYPNQERQVILGEKDIQLLGSLRGTADLLLSSPAVSRFHAKFRREGDAYYLCDLNSRNGTWVNGQQLQGEQEILLAEGDEIKFADMAYVFQSL